MTYILYQETLIPLTKSQKERGIKSTYIVDRIKTVCCKQEADMWVNKDSEHRSWSENELGAS